MPRISALGKQPFVWVAITALVLSVSLSQSQVTPNSVQLRNGNNVVMATSAQPAATDIGLVVREAGTVNIICVSGCSGSSGALNATNVNLASVGGVSVSGANVVDAANTAFRVNCVLGCAASAGTNATITNTPLPVTQSGAWALSATVTNSSLAVTIASMTTTPVTGNFFPVTQAVSIASMPTTPVSGQVTLPLSTALNATITNTSLAVTIASMTTTPVTQMSNPWTVSIASMTTTPVTQMSNPWTVSIASMTTTPVTQQSNPWTVSVTNTPAVSQSGTWNINATGTDGGIIATALPATGANASRSNLMTDKFGRLIVAEQGDRALATRANLTVSTTTETTLLAAGGAGVFWDLTHLSCSNANSASATRVDVRDTTGGTVRYAMWLAANGGGFVAPFPVPFPQTTANANWTVQLSVNVSSVLCNLVAVQNK